MAAGLMVIATKAGGIEHMLADGKEGNLIEIDDEPGLYDAIIKVQQNGRNIF